VTRADYSGTGRPALCQVQSLLGASFTGLQAPSGSGNRENPRALEKIATAA
jgi:hypothetical protein